VIVYNRKLQPLRSGGDGEGLGEGCEFLGLFGEGGGAVEDVGCAFAVPAIGGGEVAVGEGDEGTSVEVGGVECGVVARLSYAFVPCVIDGVEDRPIGC
jgi:hypothetical protein